MVVAGPLAFWYYADMPSSPKLEVEEQLRIEYMPLSQLITFPGNPKDHDLGELGKSFEDFGFVSPIIIDETSGRMVVGHGRREELANAKGRGESPPKRIAVDGKTGEWLVPVVRGAHLGNDAKRYLLSDNRITEIGGWNTTELGAILKEIVEEDPSGESLKGTGFTFEDADEIIRGIAPAPPGLGPAGGEGGNVLQFNITFQTQEQKDTWYGFLRYLEQQFPDDDMTVGSRIATFVKDNQYHG
jgi:hypothetical protein